jgi:hypothetical protein
VIDRWIGGAEEDENEEKVDDSAFMAAMDEKLEKLAIIESDDDDELAEEVNEAQAETLEKQGFWFRKKKGVMGKLGTSRLGNALFKKYMDEETVELFDTSKRIVSAHKGAALSKELHKSIMRLAVKTILLYDNETISEDDFQEFRVPFRKICALVKNNYARNIWDEHTIARLIELVTSIANGLKGLLAKHVKAESIRRLDDCAAYFASADYWNFAHKQTDDYKKIVEVFSHYLEDD